jgi:hypothetical protein
MPTRLTDLAGVLEDRVKDPLAEVVRGTSGPGFGGEQRVADRAAATSQVIGEHALEFRGRIDEPHPLRRLGISDIEPLEDDVGVLDIEVAKLMGPQASAAQGRHDRVTTDHRRTPRRDARRVAERRLALAASGPPRMCRQELSLDRDVLRFR